MIDYGIICLFTLQLAALAGAVMAWSALRVEIREVREIKSTVDSQQGAMQGQISSLEGRIQEKIEELRELGSVPRALQAKMGEWEGHMGGMQGSVDAMGDRIRSLHSRINASLRHLKREAENEADDQAEDPGQQIMFPVASAPPPAPPAPAVAPGFGRKRTA